jgi:hypothetical protein
LILKSVSLLPSETHLQLHSGVIENELSITYSLGWSCVQHGPQNCIIGRSSRAFELVFHHHGPREPCKTLFASWWSQGNKSIRLNHQLTTIFALGECYRNSSLRDSEMSSSLFFRSLERCPMSRSIHTTNSYSEAKL